MEHVDDAHSAVQSALQAVASIEIGSLNGTERDLAVGAVKELHQLDAALAERSAIKTEQLGMEVVGAHNVEVDVEYDTEHAAAPKDENGDPAGITEEEADA